MMGPSTSLRTSSPTPSRIGRVNYQAFGYDAGAVAFVALDFAVLCGSLSLPFF